MVAGRDPAEVNEIDFRYRQALACLEIASGACGRVDGKKKRESEEEMGAHKRAAAAKHLRWPTSSLAPGFLER